MESTKSCGYSYELDNNIVIPNRNIRIQNRRSFGFINITVEGWKFKAVSPGIINIKIEGRDYDNNEIRNIKTIRYEVDDNLKIHFDLDKEYIRTFYRLNVYMIFFSVVMFVILTGQCIVKCISAHIGRHGDY